MGSASSLLTVAPFFIGYFSAVVVFVAAVLVEVLPAPVGGSFLFDTDVAFTSSLAAVFY